MSNVGLKSLKNMPALLMLEELRVSDNMLSGDDLHYLQ